MRKKIKVMCKKIKVILNEARFLLEEGTYLLLGSFVIGFGLYFGAMLGVLLLE